MKNFFSFMIRLVVSGGLLYWIFSKIDIEKTKEALQSAQLGYLWLAFFIFSLTVIALILRWFIFMKTLGLKVSLRNALRWYFVGLFCNLCLPTAIGGDVVKVIGLCRTTSEKPKVFASVALDRLSGFAGITILAIIVLFFSYSTLNNFPIVISVGALGLLSLLIVTILFNEKLYSLTCSIFSFWPGLKESVMSVHYDIVLMKGKFKEGTLAIAISVLSQIILAISFYFIARAFNQHVSLIYFLIFSPLVCVVTILPSIGGLGVREFGWKSLLGKIGVAPEIAVSISLINFLFMVIVGLLGGAIYVATLSSGRIQHHPSDAASEASKG